MVNIYNSASQKIGLTALLATLLILGSLANASAQLDLMNPSEFFKKYRKETVHPLSKPYEFNSSVGIQEGPVSFSNTTKSLPQHITSYWGKEDDSWKHTGNVECIYDSQGRLVNEFWKSPTNEDQSRASFAYDVKGNEVENIREYWQAGAWRLGSGYKLDYKYNPAEQLVQVIRQKMLETWGATPKAWVNLYKTNYTYDEAGRVTMVTESEWKNEEWKLSGRTFYFYTGLNTYPDEVSSQVFNWNVWENSYKVTEMKWHDNPSDRIKEYTVQYWNGTDWVNEIKSSTELADNDGWVSVEQFFVEGAWINIARNSYIKNEQQDNISNIYEKWADEAWVVDSEIETEYTYNDVGDMTSIESRWVSRTEGLIYEYKNVYSNFFRVPTNLQAAKAKMGVNVYPNPVQNTLAIEADFTEATHLQITDLTGKVVSTRTFASGAASVQHIDLSAQAAGVYVLTLWNSKASFASKLVKQ